MKVNTVGCATKNNPTTNECRNEQFINKFRMLQRTELPQRKMLQRTNATKRTVFINKIRMLQWTRRNTIGRRSTRVRMTRQVFSVLLERHSLSLFSYVWFSYQFNSVICLFAPLVTAWCRVLLEKLTGLQLVSKFTAFHGTRRFITALTNVRHLSLSRASPIQSIYPHPTSWRYILILSTHLRIGLPSGLLSSGFPPKDLYTPLPSPICATCPTHLILLHFITRTKLGEE